MLFIYISIFLICMQIPNQYGGQKEDIKITKDEMRRIEKAMRKPGFQDLLGDYMKEISDPKNREEYDQYLQQLEQENELPKGMQLVKPEPHFCLKTMLWSKQNRKHEQKFFLNICASSIIGKPQAEDVVQEGQRGQSWKIPFAIGKIRYDQDKKGAVCNTVDVAFHQLAIGYTHKFQGFRHLLCQTALDAAQKQLGERNEDISKDYKVLKHTKCKGGEPALLPVRIEKKAGQAEQRQGGMSNTQTKLQKDIMDQQKQYQEQKKQQEPVEVDEEVVVKESNEIESDAVQQPKYKFVYSYPVDYADFLDSRQEQIKKRPNQLGCDIHLPKINSVKDVSLDIADSTLILDATNKYYLNIKLPYPIVSKDGTAKFDQKSKMLKIRAPVDPAYLKEKALEDIQKSGNYQIVEVEQTENSSMEGYTQSFIAECPPQQLDEPQLPEIVPQALFTQLSYMTRRDGCNLYLIIKLKDYKQSELKYVLYGSEFLMLSGYSFIHLTTTIFNSKESRVQFVTDFVILQLVKDTEWTAEDQIVSEDYQSMPFSRFEQKMQEYLQEQQRIQNEQTQAAEQQDSHEEQQPVQQQEDIPVQKENESVQEPQIAERMQIQFIDFKGIASLAFDID